MVLGETVQLTAYAIAFPPTPNIYEGAQLTCPGHECATDIGIYAPAASSPVPPPPCLPPPPAQSMPL